MRKTSVIVLAGLVTISLGAAGGLSAREHLTPLERAGGTPKGDLKNPYSNSTNAVDEGHRIYMSLDCSSCHGGGGGGGMAAPLTNPIWIYGNEQDTLFRLIALGTDELLKQGYSRKGSEAVMGPMPPFGDTIKTEDDLWKVLAWIRSVNPTLKP